MPYPRAPGVYFDPADSPAWSVEEARSDIAGFVGLSERGPLHEPVRVESWTQFYTRFGRSGLSYAFMPDCVKGFFENGGRSAWIVRVGNGPAPQQTRPIGTDTRKLASAVLVGPGGEAAFRIRAKDLGAGGAALSVRFVPSVRNQFHLYVQAVSDVASGTRATLEVWRDLSTRPDDPSGRFIVDVISPSSVVHNERPLSQRSSGSQLIEVACNESNCLPGRLLGLRSRHSAKIVDEEPLGWDSDVTSAEQSVLTGMTLKHFIGDDAERFGLSALGQIDEVALIAAPDLVWNRPRLVAPELRRPCTLPTAVRLDPNAEAELRIPFTAAEQQEGQLAILAHCAELRDRFAILDIPAGKTPDQAIEWREGLSTPLGPYGAVYYPWIGVASSAADVVWLPPSGHVAGMFARVDWGPGVQKAPANEVLTSVQGVETDTDAEQHAMLNLNQVNAIRSTGSRGVRVLGARTLADRSDPSQREWEYVSVRRLLLMIEKAIGKAGFWLVHAGNLPQLWRDAERVVYEFMLSLWRAGRLGGASPDEAFNVICDETTNPQESVNRGVMTCVLGVQPPLPAEFVIVRLGQRYGGAGAWSGGRGNG